MASPRKIGKKSPARPSLVRTDSDSDNDCFAVPPSKRQQQESQVSTPSTSSTNESSSMPELQQDEAKTDTTKKKVINLRLSFDDLPPQEGKDVVKRYKPQEMTCCNMDWMANTEVRLTLSKLSLTPKEERYRPSAPTPTTAECPIIIKPVPKRLTTPEKTDNKKEFRQEEEGRQSISENVQGPSIQTEFPSRPAGVFAFWKRNVTPRRAPVDNPTARSSKNDDAEVPCRQSDYEE